MPFLFNFVVKSVDGCIPGNSFGVNVVNEVLQTDAR
jgi:hypothetical protein